MLFEKSAVIDLVKAVLSDKDKRRSGDLELALGGALDDFSMRVHSQNQVKSYSVSVAVNDREATLTGDNSDLKNIFALQIGSGDDQRILDYTEPDQFLRLYDTGLASKGQQSRFTIIKSDAGFPVIRFNVPAEKAETMKVYYYTELGPDNIGIAKSKTALVAGTLAYFFGTASEAGQGYYATFIHLTAMARASDDFMDDRMIQMQLSKQDKQYMGIIKSRKAGRR